MSDFKDKVKDILKLSEHATPGPWLYDFGNHQIESQNDDHWRMPIVDPSDLKERYDHIEHFELKLDPPQIPRHPDNDGEFIAESCTIIPKLAKAYLNCIDVLRFFTSEYNFVASGQEWHIYTQRAKDLLKECE